MSVAGLYKVALIGSGNWGSAIAKIIGTNVRKLPQVFDSVVKMYVHEEMIDGSKLTDIINTQHENVKYLPGITIPDNIVAVPDVTDACAHANVLVFVLPHQFVPRICQQLSGKLPSNAIGISMIKGLSDCPTDLEMMSTVIDKSLGINCSALMGANLAHGVAAGEFSESTIGCSDVSLWPMWKNLFHCEHFKVNCVRDVHTVELCGALKNVVAIAAGLVDGLGYGDNTKAALIRLGLLEMKAFAHLFYGDAVDDRTFDESCGIADLITTCYGGRNRKVAEAFVKSGKSFEVLEGEMLNGQKLQGTLTAQLTHQILSNKGMLDQFPIFSSVYEISYGGKPASYLIDVLQTKL